MPDYIKKSDITEIVEKHVEDIQNKIMNNHNGDGATQINFSANKQLVTFSLAVKLNIFRIIQEILINIIKHSKATNADIVFSFSKKEMIIIAEDNGTGFTHLNSENGKGMGLKNIRLRVELLDGSIAIKSPAYKKEPDIVSEPASPVTLFGTMIKIKIPYRNNVYKSQGYDY